MKRRMISFATAGAIAVTLRVLPGMVTVQVLARDAESEPLEEEHEGPIIDGRPAL